MKKSEDGKVLIEVEASDIGEDDSFKIPNGIISVEQAAFWNLGSNKKLKKIEIPSSVTQIGKGAFQDSDLEYINLSEGLVKIDEQTFSYCKCLKEIVIPSSVTQIGKEAFADSDLESIKFQEGLKEIDAYAFRRCKELKKIVIPLSVTQIGQAAFADSGLESIKLQEGLEQIDTRAFDGCKGLKKIKIPSSVTEIGQGAFAGSGLESIKLQEGLKQIDAYAFQECKVLKEVVIPLSVTQIGQGAFQDSGLESITFPAGITIEKSAFDGCNKLQKILIEGNDIQVEKVKALLPKSLRDKVALKMPRAHLDQGKVKSSIKNFKDDLTQYNNTRQAEKNSGQRFKLFTSKYYNTIFGLFTGMDAETKNDAVQKMIKALNGEILNPEEFSPKELDALRDSRLGGIIAKYEKLNLLPEVFIKAESMKSIEIVQMLK